MGIRRGRGRRRLFLGYRNKDYAGDEEYPSEDHHEKADAPEPGLKRDTAAAPLRLPVHVEHRMNPAMPPSTPRIEETTPAAFTSSVPSGLRIHFREPERFRSSSRRESGLLNLVASEEWGPLTRDGVTTSGRRAYRWRRVLIRWAGPAPLRWRARRRAARVIRTFLRAIGASKPNGYLNHPFEAAMTTARTTTKAIQITANSSGIPPWVLYDFVAAVAVGIGDVILRRRRGCIRTPPPRGSL